MTIDLWVGVFVAVLGLCVGSFLNVVVYRLPRGLSISKPRWSFCPHCEHTLAWRDNIPLLGWMMLSGRCRYCRAPISAQYPLVESITALAFVLAYYLLFVVNARVGLESPVIPRDAPLLLAWLVLVAALIACSVTDLVSYMVDTRVTDAAMIAGIVLHAAWPGAEGVVPLAASPIGAAALATFVVSGLMIWISSRRTEAQEPEAPEEIEEQEHPDAADGKLAWVGIVLFVGLVVWLLTGVGGAASGSAVVIASLLAIMVTMVLAGGKSRQADEEIHAAIEQEAPQARKVALLELGWLTPAILAGAGAAALVHWNPAFAEGYRALAGWTLGGFVPAAGAIYAITGAIVGAASGWAIRIFFTIVFGREAFGVGDIFILAAAGACAGWDIVLLGFLLAVGIALAGWILGLFVKRSAMIPFGPPLALGFLTALWLNHPAEVTANRYLGDLTELGQKRPDLLLLMLALMVVGTAIALLITRLLRRLIAPAG